MKTNLVLLAFLLTAALVNMEAATPPPVRVLVWDEQQPEQKRAYGDKFLGETIAAHLAAQPGFTVRNASLASPAQGLDEATLSDTDVLIWWSHVKNPFVTDENVERIVARVRQGKLGFIALHSAHWARPFVRLMQERAKDDALAQIPDAERATAKFEYFNQNPLGKVPLRNAPLTPALHLEDGVWKLTLPGCIFPAYRGDGAPSHVTTLLPEHPIAAGLPLKWDVAQTEMYDEPFHVPKPDAVVFEERWDKGEHFRSGCVWQVGKGRVFYFRPGHEIFPIFQQAGPLRVVENAARWLALPVIEKSAGRSQASPAAGLDPEAAHLTNPSTLSNASPQVGPPLPELKLPAFYKKYLEADGYPIVASEKVNDYALREAAYLVNLMLAKRPDVRAAMIKSGSRLCIIAHNEFTTDLPEWAGMEPKDYWDARARGMGGSADDPLCSCGEENLLAYSGDPYAAECILIHEFAHNIHLRGMVNVDSTFDQRVQAAYDSAMESGLWKGKYASVNHHEYFAEGVQSWFDNNRVNDHDHNHVHLRSQLLEYDPGLAALCREVFGDTELRYTKPATRLRDHLAGYDPATAPTFTWPERLAKARTEIKQQAQARSAAAGHNAAAPATTN